MGRKVYIAGRQEIPGSLRVGAGESLEMTIVVLPGTSCEIPLEVEIDGADADVAIRGLYLCHGSEKVSMVVNLRHRVGGSTSHQLFKGIVGGTARARFHGRIVVDPDAQKTEAYQENHSLLVGDGARVDTEPQLEIYADDVKCTHGATVGRLDEEEQFYMRTRGISEKEAVRLQMLSFISPVLETIEDPDVVDEILSAL